MKQQKDNWVKILFSFAAPCKGKMALSVFCAILSVAGGFIPFWAVYEILLAFINQCIDEYYEDGTYDALWKKWIDASGEGEEAAAEEDTAAEDAKAAE